MEDTGQQAPQGTPHTPVGDYISIPPACLWRVAEFLSKRLTPAQAQALRIPSGEHLALLLTTEFLMTAPVSLDVDGGHDLVFDLAHREPQAIPAAALGMTEAPFAAFESKSLPGGFRKFNAILDLDLKSRRAPRNPAFGETYRSVNDILAHEGRNMIIEARGQLQRKAQAGQSRNIFLIAHTLEHPAIEPHTEHEIAHLLDPLTDLDGIDTVWLLWAPTHLVQWSTLDQRWINLIFAGSDRADDPDLRLESDFELLQDVEKKFLDDIGHTAGSPYLFTLRGSAGEAATDD